MKSEKVKGATILESHPIIYPHAILRYLFQDAGVRVRAEDIRAYWRHHRARGQPWALAHPASECHCPLGLYGDSAKTFLQYKHEKITAVFLNLPLWKPRSVRFSRFLLYTCDTLRMVKNRSLNAVFKKIAESINGCFRGVDPGGLWLTQDHMCFALSECRGDWEWFRDILRPKSSWQAIDICFKCPALSSGPKERLYYTTGAVQSGDQCAWIYEQFSFAEFLSHRMKDNNLCS